MLPEDLIKLGKTGPVPTADVLQELHELTTGLDAGPGSEDEFINGQIKIFVDEELEALISEAVEAGMLTSSGGNIPLFSAGEDMLLPFISEPEVKSKIETAVSEKLNQYGWKGEIDDAGLYIQLTPLSNTHE